MSRGGGAPSERDFLLEALELAARGRGATSPNPMVGAVLVRDGRVVGRGYHRCPGSAHAERVALDEAGTAARGATLYTNMEPCAHHGRTPPCADALVDAGVARVVASLTDPDPRVNGRGFERLRAAGVQVEVGLCRERAAELNEAYLVAKRRGRPFVTAKAALSLDGRLATATGVSQWITGAEARRHAHLLRAGADAVLVGVGTVLADDPRLNARHGGGAGPRLRVVLDSELRTPPGARLLRQRQGEALIVTTARAAAEREQALVAAGARVVRVAAGDDGRPSLPAVLEVVARQGANGVLVEGGGTLLTAAFDAGIIDKVAFFFAPVLIGGAGAPSLWRGRGSADLVSAPRLQRPRCRQVGSDWLVEGYLQPPPELVGPDGVEVSRSDAEP